MRKNYFLFILAILFTMNIMAQTIPSYVPKDGLVGYWPFNGNANDESGNGNHGTVNGATLTSDRNGVANSAYSFDGVDDYIVTSNFLEVNENFTISLWVFNNHNLISNLICDANTDGGNDFLLNIETTRIGIRADKSGKTLNYENNSPIELMNLNIIKKWVNIIWKMENGNSYIYLNDKLIFNTNEKGSNLNYHENGISFGARKVWNNFDNFLKGSLDDISIYNRALSDQEITALYTGNPITQNIPSYVPKDGLVGYWPFSGYANDESGNGNHGTVSGATLTADKNGVANSAYSFDGVDDKITVSHRNELNCLNITISCWINMNSFVQSSGIVNKYLNQSTNGYGIGIIEGKSNEKIHPYYFKDLNNNIIDGNSQGVIDYEDTFDNGIWRNIIFKVDNQKGYLFVDGILKSELNWQGTQGVTSSLSDLYFGWYENPGNVPNSSGYFKGIIDDIAIYNRALSEQEIAQLYAGCTKETATSSNFNTLIYTNDAPVNLSATPTGGSFSGNGVANNAFNPSKAKLGKNQVKYNFKNTTGCADSTDFTMLVVDTVGATCTKFDTVTVTNNVTKYDTLKVTKFDTVTVKNNVYDTVTFTNNVTKYDTVIVKTNVFDTVKVTKYDTLTVKNNIYDTVSILKIKFKLTTGIHANQLSSLSIYPNPTSDVLHIEVPDAKALEGYRYRILDALGKEVYNQLVTQSTTEIPLKTLGAAGIYQFEILDATKTSIQTNKIVLQ